MKSIPTTTTLESINYAQYQTYASYLTYTNVISSVLRIQLEALQIL